MLRGERKSRQLEEIWSCSSKFRYPERHLSSNQKRSAMPRKSLPSDSEIGESEE